MSTAAERSVLDLARLNQLQLDRTAYQALVTFVRGNKADPNYDTALLKVFSYLIETLTADTAKETAQRYITDKSVRSAVQRYYGDSNIKTQPYLPTQSEISGTHSLKLESTQQQQPQRQGGASVGASTSFHSVAKQGSYITNRLQMVDTTHIPFSVVDPHNETIAIASSATAAATANGFARADRQFALTQRYYAALGRCHRSGLYKRSTYGGGGITGGFRVGTGPVDDTRPTLVKISSLEGLAENVQTALLGILQYASLGGGSGSGASANLGAAGLPSTLVGWRLEDPRATIPLIFEEGFTLSNNNQQVNDRSLFSGIDGDDKADAHTGGRSKRIGFIVKGACVVAVGKWTPEGYLVKRLELPPGETREVTLSAQNHTDTFGLAPHDQRSALEIERAATSDVIIFVSRPHLDNSSVHFNLSKMFGILKDHSEDELSKMTFVFIGDFCGKAVAMGEISHASGTTVTTVPSNSTVTGIVDPTLPYIQGREGYAALFTQLAATISAANSKAAQHSRFVFVPGPRDLSILRGVLPQPPMPLDGVLGGFMKKIPHTTSASNPCRLRFLTKEIVIARSDFYQSLRCESFAVATGAGKPTPKNPHKKGSAGVVDVDEDDNANNNSEQQQEQPFEHVVKTIVDHAHLFPSIPSSFAMPSASATTNPNNVSLMPNQNHKLVATSSATAATLSATSSSQVMQRNIIWAQDHALRLSPLPHFLVLCDQTAEWSCTYRGCKVLNPGSFSSTSSFVWFEPAEGNVTFNTIS